MRKTLITILLFFFLSVSAFAQNVIYTDASIFPHTAFDNAIRKEVIDKNEAQRRVFDRLRKAGERKIYYISADGMIGNDGEATVDGIHFTDLGAMRYVDHVLPVIRKALKKVK